MPIFHEEIQVSQQHQWPSIVTKEMLGDAKGMHESCLLSFQVLRQVRHFLAAHNGTMVSAAWVEGWISAMLVDMHQPTQGEARGDE